MMTFAWQSVATMIVALIVWNRSEVILLKYLCSDIRQIAYYSVAFSMAERLLIVLNGLRIGGRRDDLCPVSGAISPSFPPSRLPRFATLH